MSLPEDFGLQAEAQCPPWAGLASLWGAGSGQGRGWGCCLVYHPQLLTPSALEAAAPCCGYFRAVCYNLQLQQGRKITKTAKPPQNGEQFFISWDLA